MLLPFTFAIFLICFADGITGGIAVILGKSAVGNYENLHKLIQSASCPKRITLIAVNLVECILYAYTATLQFHMDERKTVDKDCHIITVVKSPTFRHILVDDLKRIVVDVDFIDKRDIDKRSVWACPSLDVVLLYGLGLLNYTHIGVTDKFIEEVRPFFIFENNIVEPFNLVTEVGNQLFFRGDCQIFVCLASEPFDEIAFHLCFTLILRGIVITRLELGNNRRFRILRHHLILLCHILCDLFESQ